MRIAVLGTGALGCVFAARLAGQAEVWMLGTWAAGIAAVQRAGIRVHEGETVRQARVSASTDPADVPAADVALLLVKSYQTDRAAAWAAQVLAPDGLAVTLQNGLDNGPKLSAAVGQDRAAIGVTYIGALLIGPGEVRHTVDLPSYIGVTDATRARAQAFAALLQAAGLETRLTDDIEGRLWGKALANAVINPLTALWRVANGGPVETEERRVVLRALVEEAAAVARARGVKLPFDDPVAYVESVCRATAANHSSMYQDVTSGRPTEIDSINGVIVAEGRRLGVPTPVNEAVWWLVRGAVVTR
ncbi:MAG: hypothetical protein AUK03_06230 [Anaerolineae bacterium CG2_30_64_16]|nr:MAG: hypothetical protein AUK03_06230 [Anaerolineae bacterium CG2_30_64_16]